MENANAPMHCYCMQQQQHQPKSPAKMNKLVFWESESSGDKCNALFKQYFVAVVVVIWNKTTAEFTN